MGERKEKKECLCNGSDGFIFWKFAALFLLLVTELSPFLRCGGLSAWEGRGRIVLHTLTSARI